MIEDSVLFESTHVSDSIDNENWVSNNSLLDDYSLNNLESKESLRQIQWFDIPEIFKESPLDMNNISIYNDAAIFLLKNEMYNEARIILLEITKKYPEKEDEWLTLGDAQWGNGDEEDARESYNIYLKLMKKAIRIQCKYLKEYMKELIKRDKYVSRKSQTKKCEP